MIAVMPVGRYNVLMDMMGMTSYCSPLRCPGSSTADLRQVAKRTAYANRPSIRGMALWVAHLSGTRTPRPWLRTNRPRPGAPPGGPGKSISGGPCDGHPSTRSDAVERTGDEHPAPCLRRPKATVPSTKMIRHRGLGEYLKSLVYLSEALDSPQQVLRGREHPHPGLLFVDVNGCIYCGYGHLYAHNVNLFARTGQLFLLDEQGPGDEYVRTKDEDLPGLVRERPLTPDFAGQLRR